MMDQKKKEPDNTSAATLALSADQEKTLSSLLDNLKKVQSSNADIARAVAALSTAGSPARTPAAEEAIKNHESLLANLKGPVPRWCYGKNCSRPLNPD